MTFTSKPLLQKLSRLHSAGLLKDYDEGDRIARGFADLGYEEFILLPGSRLVSIFTGQLSAFHEEERHHFFLIPTIDQLITLSECVGHTIMPMNPYETLIHALANHVGIDFLENEKRSLRVELIDAAA